MAGAKTKLMRFKKSVEYTLILREMELNFELRFYLTQIDGYYEENLPFPTIVAKKKNDLHLYYTLTSFTSSHVISDVCLLGAFKFK